MAGFVDNTMTTLTKVSERPLSILCLIFMILLLIADSDPTDNPLVQFLKVLNDEISKNPEGGITKFAKFLKVIVSFIIGNKRFSLCVSTSLYSIKTPLNFFDVLLSIVLFAVTYFSKLSFIYIIGLSQINFLFCNAEDTNTKLTWLVIGVVVYIFGIDRFMKYIN